MSKVLTVAPGDHVPKFAAANGFADVAAIWDDPANAELKKKRQPCCLNPGDEIVIPDKEPKKVTLATNAVHRFVVKRPKIHLRVVLKDFAGKPIAGALCKVKCKGAPPTVTTGDDGKIDEQVAVDAEDCKLVFQDREVDLLIGQLTPLDEPSGQRGRLNNLGYYAGVDDRSDPEEDEEDEEDVVLRSAIEEFQCDNDLKVSGKLDADTKAKLLKAHGS